MKKVIIITSILVIIIAIALTTYFYLEFTKEKLLVSYEETLVSYEIYSKGTIIYYSEDSTVKKKITKEELEMLTELMNIRVNDSEALLEDIEKNKTILNQEWKCDAYYNEQLISLNYNFAESNVALVEYIWKLEDRYFRG
jgi:uncharacterized membrane protein YvbJ